MKTSLCIVSRTSSTRLPNKALLNIVNNVNLLDLLLFRLKTEFNPRSIVLATTNLKQDDILEEIAKKHSINFFRGEEKNVLDRLINSSSQFEDCQNIVRITGDNPLTDPFVLKQMIEDHESNYSDHTFTKSIPIGTRAEVLSLDFLKFLSRNVIDKDNTEYMTFYFQKKLGQKNKDFFIHSKKILSGDTLTVDTIEDLEFIRNIFKELKNNIYASLDEIIKTVNVKNIIKDQSFIDNKTIDIIEFNLKNNKYEKF